VSCFSWFKIYSLKLVLSLVKTLLRFCKSAEKMAKQAAMKAMKAVKAGAKPTPKPKNAKKSKDDSKKATKAKAAKRSKQAWLASPGMNIPHVVPIKTLGMTEVTIEMTMAQRMNEESIPQVRGTLMNVPWKLGTTKEGFVHWKIDKDRLKGWLKKEKSKLVQALFRQQLVDAKKIGMLF
jgi:hypothetical protein